MGTDEQSSKQPSNCKNSKVTSINNDDSKNWEVACQNCGEKPTVTKTALCGPCCFGEADTAGGNW